MQKSALRLALLLVGIGAGARETAISLMEPQGTDSGADIGATAAIERVPGVTRRGTRLGNWLTKEQANDLLDAPDPRALSRKRDGATSFGLRAWGRGW